jgi:hypothetical protein
MARTARTSPAMPNDVRRLGLVGDFLRFTIADNHCENFQPRNLAWLHQMLMPSLRQAAPNVDVRPFIAPTTVSAMAAACGNNAVFEAYRRDGTQAWAALYHTESPLAFQILFDRLLDFDLVIGFELPPVTKHVLHTAGVPYLNLFIHPLRFLRDLCLGASTNSPRIAQLLRTISVPADEVQFQVARFKGYFRRRQLERLAIPPDLPVLIGQTERDSVLIRPDGTFDSWAAHAAELDDLLKDVDAVVFIEHPMRRSSAGAIQEIRAATGKAVIATNANGYGVLMSNADIPFAVTLASSLGVEAQTLGIDARFLLADPRDKLLAPGADISIREPLGHGLWQAEFWQEVLYGSASAIPTDVRAPFLLGENYVRNSIESWAFRNLQNGLEAQPVRKTFCLAHNMPHTRRDELLAGLLHFTPHDGLGPDQAIRDAEPLGVKLELLAAPLGPDTEQEVLLGEPSLEGYTLVSGFHAPEPWGCWTSELRSELLLTVTQEAVQQQCWLSVTVGLRLYAGLAEKCPVLRITDGGIAPLCYVFFRPGHAQHSCTFTLPAKAAMVRLQLELSSIDSPAARGESTDGRWLGVALETLSVSCKPQNSSRIVNAPARQSIWGLTPRHGTATDL